MTHLRKNYLGEDSSSKESEIDSEDEKISDDNQEKEIQECKKHEEMKEAESIQESSVLIKKLIFQIMKIIMMQRLLIK